MQPHATELTPQQSQAIELIHQGLRTSCIAEKLGIRRETIWRWRQLPAFQQAQRERQQHLRAEFQDQLCEIMRLSLLAIERRMRWVEDPKAANPFEDACAVFKLLKPAQMLLSQEMAQASAPTILPPEI